MEDSPHEIVFKDYVNFILNSANDEPLCPFPAGGECYILEEKRKDGSCLECEFAKKSYEDKLLQMSGKEHRGARVFCVSCGAGKRTPLRRWHNSYICDNCWKLLNVIGEEEFLNRIKQ